LVILLETPTRQMVALSPFDPSLGDAIMLIMAKTGWGKTFMAQLLLIMVRGSARRYPFLSVAIPVGRLWN
jgi:hypothetical protein